MNTERPVAQVVVYGSASPIARAGVETRLRQMGGTVWTREPHWVVGTFPLPGSEPDSDRFIRHGLAFVEGRDRMETAYGDDAPARVVRLTERTSTIAQLPGDFTFAKLDGDTVTLVRSCAGMGHWFVHHGRDFVLAATRLRYFEDVLQYEMPLDELVLAAWTADCTLPWNRSTLVGVSVLPPAHTTRLVLSRQSTPSRYWDPAMIAPAVSPSTSGDLATEMRQTIVDSLDRDLSSNSANIVTFSGGIDSSIVTALAVQHGRRVETVSVLPTSDFDTPHSTYASVDRFLQAVRVAAHHPHYLDEHSVIDVLLASPSMRVPIMNPTLTLAASHGSLSSGSVIAGGEYADELFGGWNTLYKAWVSSLGRADFARTMIRARGIDRQTTARTWLSPMLYRRRTRLSFVRELPTFVRHDLRMEYAAYVADATEEVRQLKHPRAFVLNQLRHYAGWLLQNWEISSEMGMRRSTPFYTREAIELALATHPMDLAWPPKKLLRFAFDGLVPHGNLHRIDKDSAGYSPRAKRLLRMPIPVPDAVAAIVDAGHLDVTGPINPDDAFSLAPAVVAAQRPASLASTTTAHGR